LSLAAGNARLFSSLEIDLEIPLANFRHFPVLQTTTTITAATPLPMDTLPFTDIRLLTDTLALSVAGTGLLSDARRPRLSITTVGVSLPSSHIHRSSLYSFLPSTTNH